MLDDATTQDGSQDDTDQEKEQVGSQPSGNAGEDDDSSKSDDTKESDKKEEKSEKTLEEKKKEELDKRGYQGMIRKEAIRIAEEDSYTIDQVPEALRDDVIGFQKRLQEKISGKNQTDEQAIVEKAVMETEARIALRQAKDSLSEEEQAGFVAEYEELKEKGYTPPEALDKAKKIHQVLSPEERQRKEDLSAMGAVSGGSAPDKPAGKFDPLAYEKFNANQKKMGLPVVSKEAFLSVT